MRHGIVAIQPAAAALRIPDPGAGHVPLPSPAAQLVGQLDELRASVAGLPVSDPATRTQLLPIMEMNDVLSQMQLPGGELRCGAELAVWGRAGLGAVNGVPASGLQTLKAGTIDGFGCPGGPGRGAPRTDRGKVIFV